MGGCKEKSQCESKGEVDGWNRFCIALNSEKSVAFEIHWVSSLPCVSCCDGDVGC